MKPMRKITIVLGFLSLLLIFLFTSVEQVTGNTQSTYDEENKYSNVGIYANFVGEPEQFLGCSGTLISPTVFLTAAHCSWWMTLPEFSQGKENLYVSFDWKVDLTVPGNHWIKAKDLYVHPLFGHDRGNFYDLAVIILPEGSTEGLTPATLTTEGLLDEELEQGSLRDKEFLGVGYGIQMDWEKAPPQQFWERWGWRNYATAPLMALTPANIYLNINEHATGGGGACYGDSGGPLYLPMNGHNILVGVTTAGMNRPCRATAEYYRIDTPWSREFLGQFVQLP